MVPPQDSRRRRARALGVRPRPSAWVLTGISSLFVAVIEVRSSSSASGTWLSDQLERAMLGLVVRPPAMVHGGLATWTGLGLGLLVLVLATAVLTTRWRGRARASLGVSERLLAPERGATLERGAITVATALVIAIAVTAMLHAGVLAAAARCVDASTPALELVWSTWITRGLLALAGASVGVGLVEQRIEARRVWRALHQTRAQAQLDARANARRTAG